MRAALILLALTLPLKAETRALTPPLAPPEVAAALEGEGIDARLLYATTAENVAKPKPPPPPEAQRLPGGGSVSTLWVLGILLVALLVWLRFGGSGILTRRAPQEGAPVVAPAHWGIQHDVAPLTLLDQIAAMENRSEALVRLLRHCLLRTAEETRTRLARADTEREAFARLPGDRPGLRLILQAAELAHYGGRPVSDAGFAAALDQGRRILGGAHA